MNPIREITADCLSELASRLEALPPDLLGVLLPHLLRARELAAAPDVLGRAAEALVAPHRTSLEALLTRHEHRLRELLAELAQAREEQQEWQAQRILQMGDMHRLLAEQLRSAAELTRSIQQIRDEMRLRRDRSWWQRLIGGET